MEEWEGEERKQEEGREGRRAEGSVRGEEEGGIIGLARESFNAPEEGADVVFLSLSLLVIARPVVEGRMLEVV
eukprot:1391587-Amorphochlora_amoeboformis.AAC.1